MKQKLSEMALEAAQGRYDSQCKAAGLPSRKISIYTWWFQNQNDVYIKDEEGNFVRIRFKPQSDGLKDYVH